MYIKKLKRKCGVRGCRCTESFAISLNREMGNSVIICKSCLSKALGAIDGMDGPSGVNPERKEGLPLQGSAGSESFREVEGALPYKENVDSEMRAESCRCPECGRVFNSKRGLASHLKSCKEKGALSR